MDVNLATIVAILQVDIALGILYVGLKEFRFREKLHHNIATAISDSGFVTLARSNTLLGKLFAEDNEFSRHYHTVREWILELPDSDRQKIERIDELNIALNRPERPVSPSIQRDKWFLRDRDKRMVWAVVIVPSLAVMWLLVFFQAGGTQVLGVITGILGQLVLARNVFLGRVLARRAEREVQDSVKYIMNKYGEQRAESDVNKATDRLA